MKRLIVSIALTCAVAFGLTNVGVPMAVALEECPPVLESDPGETASSSKITAVANTATTMPGTKKKFAIFHTSTACPYAMKMSGKYIAFWGQDAAKTVQGIYLYDGSQLKRVADTSTYLPGTKKKFVSFSSLSLSGSRVAFFATGGSKGTTQGVYLYKNGTLSCVANTSTTIPGTGSKKFLFGTTSTAQVMISGNNVVFYGYDASSTVKGLYLSNGSNLEAIADTDTAVPNETNLYFTDFLDPVMDPGYVSVARVAFTGQSAYGGYYLYNGTSKKIQVVVDRHSEVPNTGGLLFNWKKFGLHGFTANGGSVALWGAALDGSVSGDYLHRNGRLASVITTDTKIPGTTRKFSTINGTPRASGKYVADLAGDSSKYGIMLYQHGAGLKALAAKGTKMPGSTVKFGSFDLPVLNGKYVCFRGVDSSYSARGLYLHNGTALKRVVDRTVLIPGTKTAFWDFDIPMDSVGSDGKVAFWGTYKMVKNLYQYEGIYLYKP